MLTKIPSLNQLLIKDDLNLLNGKLVRFTGFVQDMLDNDYYLGALKTSEDLNGCKALKYITLPDAEFKDVDQ